MQDLIQEISRNTHHDAKYAYHSAKHPQVSTRPVSKLLQQTPTTAPYMIDTIMASTENAEKTIP